MTNDLNSTQEWAQDAFNRAVAGLKAQGWKRSGEARGPYVPTEDDEMSFQCKYRGPDGTKCAVGHLIPDHLYEETIENMSVMLMFEERPEIAEHIGAHSYGQELFLSKLQAAHDCYVSEDPAQMREMLRKVAEEFGLDAGVVGE